MFKIKKETIFSFFLKFHLQYKFFNSSTKISFISLLVSRVQIKLFVIISVMAELQNLDIEIAFII